MSDIIRLNQNDYCHLRERSSYNNNFYQHRETGEILLEICDEAFDSYSIYRLENGDLEFIGCSVTGMESEIIEIYSNLY